MKKEVEKQNKRVGAEFYEDRRLCRQAWDWSLEHGHKTVLLFTLIGAIQGLAPEHYREVMKGIIKAVGTSNDEMAIQSLTRKLAQTVDYILSQERVGMGQELKVSG